MKKNKIFLFLIFILIVFLSFSQDTLLHNDRFQVSVNISIPRDYNTRRMLPIRSEALLNGYSVYNKLGGALTIEYLKRIKTRLFLRAGLGFTMRSSYITAKGNEVLILHQYSGPLESMCMYESNNMHILMSPLLGVRYQLKSKSSVFFSAAFNLVDIDVYKTTYWDKSVNTDVDGGVLFYSFYGLIDVGYSHLIYRKINFLINMTVYLDNLSNPYFGTGLIYKF